MRLKVLVPTEILFDEEVGKVVAEAENGSFCVLPKHIDFVAALVPGILRFADTENVTGYIAIDHGVLVKCGSDVLVSTLNGVRGGAIEDLKRTVDEQFRELDEQQRVARTALARLEAGAMRSFRALQEETRGRR